jgi:hypothetical protein
VTFVTRGRLVVPTTYRRGRQVLTKRDTARRGRLDIERRIFVTRQACDVR